MRPLRTRAKTLDELGAGARWETMRAGYWSSFGDHRSDLAADCQARANYYTTRFLEARE
jgi:hypothetical protein